MTFEWLYYRWVVVVVVVVTTNPLSSHATYSELSGSITVLSTVCSFVTHLISSTMPCTTSSASYLVYRNSVKCCKYMYIYILKFKKSLICVQGYTISCRAEHHTNANSTIDSKKQESTTRVSHFHFPAWEIMPLLKWIKVEGLVAISSSMHSRSICSQIYNSPAYSRLLIVNYLTSWELPVKQLAKWQHW